MRRIALAVMATTALTFAALGAATQSASAAPYNWTGFYIGLHAGGVWGKSAALESGVTAPSTGYNGIGNNWSANTSGFNGGVQAGYNWQIPSSFVVWGIEGDLGYLGFKGSAISPLALTQASATTVTTKGGFYGTIRGRLGVAPGMGNTLIYITGGGIFANVKGQITDPVVAFALPPSPTTGTQWGGIIGGGLEMALSGAWAGWSVKGEYLYFNLGTKSVTTLHIDHTHTWDIKSTGNILRLGLNRHF
jgi:outer membrane immunogenic protein